MFGFVAISFVISPALGFSAKGRDDRGFPTGIDTDTFDKPSSTPSLAKVQAEGLTAFREKDYAKAQVCFEKALKLDDIPVFPSAKNLCRFKLAQALMHLKKFSDAREEYLKLPDTDTESRLGAAEACFEMGKFDDALSLSKDTEAAIEREKEEEKLHDQKVGAGTDYEFIRAEDNKLLRARAVRGKSYFKLGKTKLAKLELSAYGPSGDQRDSQALEIRDILENGRQH